MRLRTKWFRKLGLGRAAANRMVKTIAILTEPREYVRRRNAAHRLALGPVLFGEIPLEDGYLRFDSGGLPGAALAVETCRKVFEAWRANGDALRFPKKHYKKQNFMIPVLWGQDACAHPELLEFALSPAVLQTVSKYLAAVPILLDLRLLWTQENETEMRSQQFHFDTEDASQVKVFLHVTDVDEETGPFTLIPAAASERVARSIGYEAGRIDDAALAACGAGGDAKAMTGPAESGFFVDTARCLHFGSRRNRNQRIVLLAHFTSYHAPRITPATWAPAVETAGLHLDPLQRMVLRA
jgi:hypothetical protein